MKRIYSLALTLLTVLGLTSCAQSPKTVTLIAHDSFVMSDDLIGSFEETFKVDLKIVRAGDAGAMLPRDRAHPSDPRPHGPYRPSRAGRPALCPGLPHQDGPSGRARAGAGGGSATPGPACDFTRV